MPSDLNSSVCRTKMNNMHSVTKHCKHLRRRKKKKKTKESLNAFERATHAMQSTTITKRNNASIRNLNNLLLFQHFSFLLYFVLVQSNAMIAAFTGFMSNSIRMHLLEWIRIKFDDLSKSNELEKN